jgi:8-amino-3,8-dideoxy-alpha-D-manno-octulosonate transaminase
VGLVLPGNELIGREELRAIERIFSQSGGVLFRHGFDKERDGIYRVSDFERSFGSFIGSKHCLAVSSGTAAVKIALQALGVGPGDEVITQSFTFIATVEAILSIGAIPVIVDVDNTLNLDGSLIQAAITPKTRAVVAVHMLGVPADMVTIKSICEANNLFLVEDTAWGLGAKLEGQTLGTIGDAGTFSFDYAKTMTTGEGGMVTFRVSEHHSKAVALHDHGHLNLRGITRLDDPRNGFGFNYRMSEIQGAIGLAQLKKVPRIIDSQRRAKGQVLVMLKKCSDKIWIRPEPINSESTHDGLVFCTVSDEVASRLFGQFHDKGLGAKILPNALRWHFAKEWLDLPLIGGDGQPLGPGSLGVSERILRKAVAIGIPAKFDSDWLSRVKSSIEGTLRQ